MEESQNDKDLIEQIILKYDFSLLNRGEKPIEKYLSSLFSRYINSIKEINESNNSYLEGWSKGIVKKINECTSSIETETNEIINILELHRDGHQYRAYEAAQKLFEKLNDYFLPRYKQSEGEEIFKRIRSNYKVECSMSKDKQKAELLHIKESDRNKIGAYRYSVPGHPCLYLSESLTLAWLECGMPESFSYIGLKLKKDNNKNDNLKMISIGEHPSEFWQFVHMNIRKERHRENIVHYLISYLVTFPLAASCSLRVNNRDDKFVQEYIMPQFLMQWVLESDQWDGVNYLSCFNSDLVNAQCARNLAIPISSFREDGLGEKITSEFEISEVEYYDLKKKNEVKLKKNLEALVKLKKKIFSHRQNKEVEGKKIDRIYFAINCTIQLINALINHDYSNINLIFEYKKLIFDYYSMILNDSTTDTKEEPLNKINVEDYKADICEFSDIVSKLRIDFHDGNEPYFSGRELKNYKHLNVLKDEKESLA